MFLVVSDRSILIRPSLDVMTFNLGCTIKASQNGLWTLPVNVYVRVVSVGIAYRWMLYLLLLDVMTFDLE